ncbi:prostatic acid phosphatase [Crotalus tigris]|uniref:prostatic acid phosphatase n=1 Tax=Crotalus tigris TaxID=88082 RepID=UPI00192FAFB8|nr:prostatic acid phosphatase [Crotalus tigris]
MMNLVFILHSLGFSSLSLFFGLLFHCATGRQMKFNVILYRHGDRSPISSFPRNTVGESTWPRGYGQLTKTGTQQAYQLGQWLKDRYKNFLSPSYKPKEIYVRSTDYDRTIMSAQAVLAGLFPPSTEEKWNPNINWQPIPVHTVPISDEKLLKYPNYRCPSFNGLLQQVIQEMKTKNELQKYMALIQKVAYNLGYDIKKLMDFQNMLFWKVYDTLKVQEIHKLCLPRWADKKTMEQMKFLLEYLVNAGLGRQLKNEKSKLQGGILVKHILEKIINVTKCKNRYKMIMYSAHDMTIIALQIALGVYNQLLPPYAATHIFELYKEDNGSYTIEMYYRNSTAVEPHLLTLPGCTKACPLNKFQNLVAPILPTKEC